MAKIKFKERIVPDEGRHLVTLKGVKEIENRFYNPTEHGEGYKTQFEWTFEYDDKQGMEIRCFTTLSPTQYKGKKNKILLIEEALLGKYLSAEEMKEIDDTDALIGMKCYINVAHQPTEDGQIGAKIVLLESVTKK